MTTEIAVSKTLSIRECGYDEHWLQGKIAADPSILGLGGLEVVRREKLDSEPCKDGSVWMRARVDQARVEENADLFQRVAESVKKCWS